MRHLFDSVLGMVTGVALVAAEMWLWWWLAFESGGGVKLNLMWHLLLPVCGVFLFGFSFRRYRRIRQQQLQNQPIQPPSPPKTITTVGRILWIAGHVVAGLSVLRTIAMVLSGHFDPSGGEPFVPLVMGLMLSGILYACGAAFKNG